MTDASASRHGDPEARTIAWAGTRVGPAGRPSMTIGDRLRSAHLPPLTRSMWLEIDVAALRANLRVIRGLVAAGTAVWPVVKADGYGHGAEVAARAFVAGGADGVCVATLEEAIALRHAGIDVSVLILYPVPPGTSRAAAGEGFELAVSTVDGARLLAEEWRAAGGASDGLVLRVHVEVETGLTRMGIAPSGMTSVLESLRRAGITVAAIWSHLATAEDGDASGVQERRLAQVVETDTTDQPRRSHLAATGGLLTGRGLAGSLVRPGLIAYGVAPSLDLPLPSGFLPAMRLKATASRILEVPTGTTVGYGGTWLAARPSRIATLPVGYGDGYVRAMSGAPVLVRGVRASVVGAVSMDALTVDLTDIPAAGPADEFVLLGPQGHDAITALELAQVRTSIPWEVLTSMTRRPTRVYDAAVGLLGVRTLAGETLVQGASWS